MAHSLSCALALLGGVIGAGFASGKEIMHFFARHGSSAYLSCLCALSLLAFVFFRLPAQMQRTGCSSLPALCRAVLGNRFGSFCGTLFFLLCAITGGAMLAACAELAALTLNLRHAYALGMIVSLLLSICLTKFGLSGLALPGAALCALLPLLLIRLLALPAGESAALPRTFPLRAAADGLIYGALNAAMLAGMLPQLLSLSRKRKRHAILLFSASFGMMLILGTLVCQRRLGEIWDQPLPFVWLSRSLGAGGYTLVAACMYAAALSTFCAMLCAMAHLLSGHSARSLPLCASLCFAASLLGFSRLVRSGYSVLGLLCAGLLLLLCLPIHAVRNESKEAGA